MPATTISRAVRPLVDFVYPPRCPLCGTAIAAGPGLCVDCWSELEAPGEPACMQCQMPMQKAVRAANDPCVCQGCLANPPRHAGIAAATLYTEPARALVLRFKHGGRIGLATLMGRLIAARLGSAPADALLVPVPLHYWRLWRRGYNQAALLTQMIARQTGREEVRDALHRPRSTPSLGGLGRAQRAQALRGAIIANPRRMDRIRGRDVVLVDDVLTSGATTAACTEALLDAGARSVRIACFARVAEGLPLERETPGIVKTPGAA